MQGIGRLVWAVVLLALLIGFLVGFQVGVTAAQSSGPGLSMTSEAVAGGWRMVISGPSGQVARVCSFGDCARVFASPVAATNYFLSLFGLANGLNIAPIPSAP